MTFSSAAPRKEDKQSNDEKKSSPRGQVISLLPAFLEEVSQSATVPRGVKHRSFELLYIMLLGYF